MLRQKREKNGTGICHVMQGKESKGPVPPIQEEQKQALKIKGVINQKEQLRNPY